MIHVRLLIHFSHCCVSYVSLRTEHLYMLEASPTLLRNNSFTEVPYVFMAHYTIFNTLIHHFTLCDHITVIRQSSSLKPTDIRFHFHINNYVVSIYEFLM